MDIRNQPHQQQTIFDTEGPETRDSEPVTCLGMAFENDEKRREYFLDKLREKLKDPEYSYFITNAPVSTRLGTFVWLSGLRWAVEQCFEETKTELGMDHYEVRKYKGWHHHILVCILAHFFLWHLKITPTPNIQFPQNHPSFLYDLSPPDFHLTHPGIN